VSGGGARLHGGVSPEARARAHRGSRGAGKGPGRFGVTQRTWPWARRRHKGIEGWRSKVEWLGGNISYSSEQLRMYRGREWGIWGIGRSVTLREASRTLERRQRHVEASGRRWRSNERE
jgi:hypothetical protein